MGRGLEMGSIIEHILSSCRNRIKRDHGTVEDRQGAMESLYKDDL